MMLTGLIDGLLYIFFIIYYFLIPLLNYDFLTVYDIEALSRLVDTLAIEVVHAIIIYYFII